VSGEFEAVMDRLEDRFPGKVTDTVKLTTAGEYVRDNYVIVLGGVPDEFGGDRQAFRQVEDDNAVLPVTVQVVGVSAAVVRSMLSAAMDELVGWKPVVDGRNCSIRFESASAPEPDTSVKPPLFVANANYIIRSLFTSRAGS